MSDCGENILRALAEPTAVVRTKAAWALGNLSDALVLNMLVCHYSNILIYSYLKCIYDVLFGYNMYV